MSHLALLEAGAVLPVGTPVAKDDTVDALTTRAYAHPVLEGRTVVRLVPAAVGAAEDLSMEFLGFDKPAPVNEVGLVRQQALGFPAWALVHDPANGHHALALVKEIEKLARTAKSRIGPAKEGFDALGERLARAVPHFLPTFYEEAGRAFLAADSTTYAATMFGKARDAERAYALRIDEERQHAVFLEFALAGAITAKALTQHARELAARSTPTEAYERFLRLCVERTLGGLPPYAAMHTDLRRLAKAAKLDQAEADRDVLAQLLPAPALIRAAESFWTAYSTPLAQLAAADPALRGRLLGMFPANCTDDGWLGVLEQAGATRALTEPAAQVPAEAAATDGPAGWLARFDEHRQRRYWRDRHRSARLLDLVERMAPRLKADGVPVALARRHGSTDLDLLDACLALGVPVADPAGEDRFNVAGWLRDDKEGRRELVAVAGDARFVGRLAAGVESHLEEGFRQVERVREVTAVPGLRTALHHWLDQLAASAAGHGLPTLGGHFDRIAQAACPEGAAVNEPAMARLLAHDVAGVLAHTLRAGVLDEFGWPALEEAVVKLAGAGGGELMVVDQWPYLILVQGDLALVVGEQGVELEHILRIPADQRRWMYRTVLRYVDKQLLVCWDVGRERAGYWTGAPDDVFTVPDEAFQMYHQFSLPITGGGRTAGARPLHAGDRGERRGGRVLTDGVTYWVLLTEDGKVVCREFDPATGERGRPSLPSFFEDGAADGRHLAHHSCRLSVRDNGELLGWRVHRDGTGAQYGQALDGTAYTMPATAARRGELSAAIRFPGAERTCGVTESRNWRNTGMSLYDADGLLIGEYSPPSTGEYARGTQVVPTPAYWHLLRPRDEAGSAALRALTDEQAAALLAEAARIIDAATGDEAAAQITAGLVELVARQLPAITDRSLRDGVAGVVERAAAHAARLATLVDRCAGKVAEAASHVETPSYDADDRRLTAALSGLMPYCYSRGDSATRMLTAVGQALTGAERPTGRVELAGDHDWFDVLGLLPAVMYRAASPVTGPEHRDTLAELLAVVVRSGLLAPGGRLRQVELKSDRPIDSDELPGTVRQVGDRRLLILTADSDDRELGGLEYAPDGVFGAVPGCAITAETPVDFGGVTPETVTAFTALLAERGPLAWQPELVARLSTEAGMSLAEAALLLAGLPQANWSRAESEPVRALIGVPDGDIAAAAASRTRAGGRAGAAAQLARLMPADPAALWTGGPDASRLAEAWAARHGRRTPVRDELIVAIAKADVDGSMNASELIHGIANPDTCTWLAGTAPGIDDEDVLVALAKCVPWLAYHLPADDPIRAVLPRVAELVRAKLADPALRLPIGWVLEKKAEALLNATGQTPVTEPDGGLAAGALLLPPDTGYRAVQLRPALLHGAGDPVLSVVQSRLDSHDEGTLAALRAVLDGQLARLAGYPVPAGVDGYAQDPTRSAPELVAQVAAAHGLTADAAALYLQLLALPDPTDRNVASWTGWKPARLKAARAALAATDLVVEAKRPRAGRGLFLPGGWLALKAPHLPLERWKLPLLIGGEQGVSGLGIVLPVAPAPQLFTLAWERISQGDAPRFDELVTGRQR